MMRDKTEKNISLIEISNNHSKEMKKNKNTQIAIRHNSKYAPLKDKIQWPFDYEVNNIRFDTLNKNKLYFIKDKHNENCYDKPVNFSSFADSIMFEFPYDDKYKLRFWDKVKCSLKRLVSQKKRRIETESFNLDMSYITRRVIAMGYPSKGCETIYRNSLNETKRYFSTICVWKNKGYTEEKILMVDQ